MPGIKKDPEQARVLAEYVGTALGQNPGAAGMNEENPVGECLQQKFPKSTLLLTAEVQRGCFSLPRLLSGTGRDPQMHISGGCFCSRQGSYQIMYLLCSMHMDWY